jgi:23S rRNA-/tRNA-specific pseudouridylate synthase
MRVVERGGKKAVTDYEVTVRAEGVARVALWPRTGRTHQLRVQLASMGAPILGDRIYGDVSSAPRLLLHAQSLEIPATAGHAARHFTSPVPF